MPVTTLSRQEFLADISFSPNTVATLPTQGGNLPLTRWLYGIMLEWEGRTTNPGTGNPTGVKADAPYSILERVTIEGYNRVDNRDYQLIDLRGADLREYYSNQLGVSFLSIPATLNTAANATNDIRFVIPVIFPPLRVAPALQASYLLDAPNFDSLILRVVFGDASSIFNLGSGSVSFSGFGSSTGSPRLRVSALYAMGGPTRFAGFRPGRVFRTFREVTTPVQSTATAVRQVNIPVEYEIRSIMIKTGVKSTAVTAGLNAFASLSDTIYQNIVVYRGTGVRNRWYADFDLLKQEDLMISNRLQPTGYATIDWSPRGLDELLDVRGLTEGEVYIEADVTGAANQAAVFVFERWLRRPGGGR